MKAFLHGLRFRLLILVLVGGLPSLVLTFYTAAEQRRHAAQEIQRDALRVARIASAGQERMIEGARQLLVMLARIPEANGTDSEAANQVLANLRQRYSNYANFGVIERDGTVFASAVPLPKAVNLSDRLYFVRAVEKRGFAMGEYQIGRITGIPTVNFGYPILGPFENVRRVVFVALELEWLEQLAAEAELPPGAALSVVDDRGTILARWPNPENWRGKSLATESIWNTITRQREGTANVNGHDGDSLFAFTQLRGAEGAGFVSVNIGIPAEVAYAEPNRMLKRNLTLLCLAGALAVAAAWIGGDWFVLRQVRALIGATRELEAGNLSARTGTGEGRGELAQLARSFDAMADSLQQRGEERDRAQRELLLLNQELEKRVAERTLELREKNEELEADLAMAREFQLAMLPRDHPVFPKDPPPGQIVLRFYHRYETSGAVGGDYFDILPLSENRVAVFVCDVMGHGVRAALVTAMIRGLFDELKVHAQDPGRFVTEMNRGLYGLLRGTGTTMFVTACYAVFDVATGEVAFANAGHPWPLRLSRPTRTVESLKNGKGGPGPALGLFENSTYQTCQCRMNENEALILFTDGVFEVSGRNEEEFGRERLTAVIGSRLDLPTDKILQEVIAKARGFSATGQFDDDVCMVGIELRK